jgi:hypothetical protein
VEGGAGGAARSSGADGAGGGDRSVDAGEEAMHAAAKRATRSEPLTELVDVARTVQCEDMCRRGGARFVRVWV